MGTSLAVHGARREPLRGRRGARLECSAIFARSGSFRRLAARGAPAITKTQPAFHSSNLEAVDPPYLKRLAYRRWNTLRSS